MFCFLVLWGFIPFAIATRRHFTLTLTWGVGTPDGYPRNMIFVNNIFPGPTLNIRQGDDVEVDVVNNLPEETSVHFHGIEQYNSPASDGVPGLTQSRMKPGESRRYTWTAHQYGSYFYHAHSQSQVDDGLIGPIIIRPREGLPRPFDKITVDPSEVEAMRIAEYNVKPILISDWRHKTAKESLEIQNASSVEALGCMDSILINGKGSVNCWPRSTIDFYTRAMIKNILGQNGMKVTDKGCTPPEILRLLLDSGATTAINTSAIPHDFFHTCIPTNGTSGQTEVVAANPMKKWLALDVISAASIETFAFSIDGHPVWIYAVDGYYIEPVQVHAFEVANGYRYSVMVRLSERPANYGIRVASVSLTQLIDTTAVLAYDGATDAVSDPYIDQAGGKSYDGVVFFNASQMLSFPPVFPAPPPEPAQTFIMKLGITSTTNLWALNQTEYPSSIEDSATPWLSQDPNSLSSENVVMRTKNNTWVDLIFVTASKNQPPHPLHKHGNKAFIIGRGSGEFSYSSVNEAMHHIPEKFNLGTPPYRDGFVTESSGQGPTWMALRYYVNNPGAWMIHCHIQSHLQGGMAAVILDGVDAWPKIAATEPSKGS